MVNQFSRREFLRALISAPAASALSAISSNHFSEISTCYVDINIASLAREFSDYRIAFISDLHLGVWTSKEFVAQAFKIVHKENPDLILLGGDYVGIVGNLERYLYSWRIDHSLDSQSQAGQVAKSFSALTDLLGSIKAKDGIFGVSGNHDNWWGPNECRTAFKDGNAILLTNQSHVIERGLAKLEIIGLDDLWTDQPRYQQSANPASTKILLSHNPDYIFDLLHRPNAHFDLALCGHTHGGQVVLPLLGALFYNIENTQLATGLYQAAGPRKSKVYTSRGVGYVKIPFRWHCPAEVTIFTLKID